MKNKKGFTLIEMIGVVIIIGIIAIIAFNTFTGNLKEFRDDYYTDLERTLSESGKEFFNDNRRFRPDSVFFAQKVTLDVLVAKNYISEVEDYNGNSCRNDSYVIIIKEGKDDYTYHSCLVCSEDNFDNTDDSLCDPSWFDPSTISYGLGTLPTLYIYKGTPRDKLREQLTLPISIIKKDASGNILKEIRGNGIDDVPTILPKNIDIVNPDKIGTYKVEYEYTDAANEKQQKTTNVIVYENDAPRTNITYENIVARDLDGNPSIESGTYLSGKWVQKITLNLTANALTDPESKVVKYQWNKNGKWQDICTEVISNGSCTREITTEMNEEISFRTIDSKGNIGIVTSPIVIKIDNTKPTCTLKKTGTVKDNGWYVSDVTVSFDINNDLVPSNGNHNAISQVKISNITSMPGNISRTSSNDNKVHSDDTDNVEYRGYVEDKAGNFYVCKTTLKKDGTAPSCSIGLSGTKGDNDWYTTNVDVSFRTHSDNLSGVAKYGIDSYDGNRSTTHTADTSNVTYTGYIKDNAGNTATCSNSFKKDGTSPSCSINLSGTKGDNDWYTTNVDVSFRTHSDNLSGVAKYGIDSYDGNRSTTHTADTSNVTYTGYIKDNAGNTATCSNSFKKDGTSPSCSINLSGTKGDNDWYTTNVDVSFRTHSDNLSGVAKYGIDSYDGNKSATHTADTSNVTYTGYIKDKAGNTATCSDSFKKDGTKPSCGNWSGESTSWTKENREISVGCSDSTSTCDKSKYSTTISSGTTSTKSISFEIKDKAGNKETCRKTANVYVDKEAPTCTTSKSNEGTTSGVNVSISCNNVGNGSNVTCPSSENGVKSSKTYTVRDAAGNTSTCNVSVTPQSQKRTNTCSTGKRCSSASCETYTECKTSACGVNKYKSCKNSACGTEKCNCSSCYTTKNTCVGGYVDKIIYDTGDSFTSQDCYNKQGVVDSSGRRCIKSEWNSCKTGSPNECVYGCGTCNKTCRTEACGIESYNSCRTSACGCETYSRDINKCGCETWKGWTGWSNANCTPSSSNSSQTECRTVYN